MNILFLGQLPPPVHGAAVINEYAYDVLRRQFSSVKCINLSKAEGLADVGRISMRKLFLIALLYIEIAFTVLKERFDLCYFSFCPNGSAFYRDSLIVFILKIFRIKLLLHIHGRGLGSDQHWFKRFLCKLVFRKVDVIHLSSLFWKELEDYVCLENFHIIPNCVEDIGVNVGRKRKAQPIRFYYLSNFVEGKGVLYLLDAAKILYHKGVDCTISLAGEWFDLSLKSTVDAWIKDNQYLIDSGYVRFFGPIYNEEKIRFIRSQDVLVFPSYIDTFPLVVVEALSAGNATVATETGAIPEILGFGDCGLLVKEHDVSALAGKMFSLVEDRTQLERLFEKSRSRFDQLYGKPAFREKLVDLISTLKEQ